MKHAQIYRNFGLIHDNSKHFPIACDVMTLKVKVTKGPKGLFMWYWHACHWNMTKLDVDDLFGMLGGVLLWEESDDLRWRSRSPETFLWNMKLIIWKKYSLINNTYALSSIHTVSRSFTHWKTWTVLCRLFTSYTTYAFNLKFSEISQLGLKVKVNRPQMLMTELSICFLQT